MQAAGLISVFHKIKLHKERSVLQACERKDLVEDLIKTKISVRDELCMIYVCDNKLLKVLPNERNLILLLLFIFMLIVMCQISVLLRGVDGLPNPFSTMLRPFYLF